MARPRRQADETAIFVRIPSTEADKLHRAANALGAPKRELITRLVAQHVDPENPATLSRLGGAEWELGVGRAWTRSVEELEILTPEQLATLLQVDEQTVIGMAERKEIPARKVGDEWRFSREAVLAWLAEDE
jgi:excisionase family DNA binding protein